METSRLIFAPSDERLSICLPACSKMEVGVRGHLGPETVADLIREVGQSRLSGLLRLTLNKQIKVIFFESGKPIFAIGSLPHEQQEQRFIQEGLATAEQIAYAKRLSSNPNELGPSLAKLGAAPLDAIEIALKDLAFKVIMSTFEWRAGDYFFDPRAGGQHPVDINCTAEDCIVSGARRASQLDSLLNSTASGNRTVFAAKEEKATFGRTAKLNSVEGYVLSCISSPIKIEDISTLTGLSDLEVRRAAYVLMALGLIDAEPLPEPVKPSQSAETMSRPPRSESNGRGTYPPVLPVTEPQAPAQQSAEPVNIFFAQTETASTVVEEDLLIDLENTQFPGWGGQETEVNSVGVAEERVPISPAATRSPEGAATQYGDIPSNSFARGQARSSVEPPAEVIARNEQRPWGRTSDTDSSGELSDAARQEDRTFSAESLEQVLSKLENRLEKLDSSNLYQVLGVTKLASKATIQVAYEGLKRAYDSYRSEWPGHQQLISSLDSLQSLTEKAYEILVDPEKRRVYDMPKSTPIPPPPPPLIERGQAEEMRRSPRKEELSAPVRKPLPIDIPKSAPARPANSPGFSGGANPFSQRPSADYGGPTRNETADDFYRRGRAYYERHDFHTAAHMLREAVRLDPSRAIYHYHLGVTLGVLSQARAVHKHDNGCHVTCKMGGGLHRNQRIRHEAEQHLLKAAELEPSNADIRLKLAQLYKEAGMEKKAEQYFHEVLLLNPSSKIAQVELGLGDPEPNVDPVTGRRIRKTPKP